MQRVGSEDVRFDLELPGEPLVLPIDRRLITQALTNLAKNALEAIEARLEREPDIEGRIVVRLETEDDWAVIRVIDNGRGLPKENRQRLTEPYMTTREKGTGLGLAIVKRIMEEHGGRLELDDVPEGRGAMVSLWLPLERAEGAGDAAQATARRESQPQTTEDD